MVLLCRRRRSWKAHLAHADAFAAEKDGLVRLLQAPLFRVRSCVRVSGALHAPVSISNRRLIAADAGASKAIRICRVAKFTAWAPLGLSRMVPAVACASSVPYNGYGAKQSSARKRGRRATASADWREPRRRGPVREKVELALDAVFHLAPGAVDFLVKLLRFNGLAC